MEEELWLAIVSDLIHATLYLPGCKVTFFQSLRSCVAISSICSDLKYHYETIKIWYKFEIYLQDEFSSAGIMSCSSIVKLLHKSRSPKYLFRFEGSIFLFHALTEKVMTIEKVWTSMERSCVTPLSGVNANLLFTFVQHHIPWNIICYFQNRKFMQPSLSTNSCNYMTFLSAYIFGLWRY